MNKAYTLIYGILIISKTKLLMKEKKKIRKKNVMNIHI